MKFTINRDILLESLDIVSRIVANNNTLPVLDNVLISCSEDDQINLSCTNLEIAVKKSLKCKVETKGKITLPAKLLLSYVSLVKDGQDITFDVKDKNTCIITTKEGETELKIIDAESFPILPEISESSEKFQIPVDEFTKGVDLTIFSVSSTNVRPTLAGVFIYTDDENIVFVSTDIYRLSEHKMKKPKNIKELKTIIPARTLVEFVRIFGKKDSEVECLIDKNQIVFRANDIVLISRIIEGKFPDYKKIIPEKPIVKALVEKSDFQRIIKRVSLFAKEQNYNLKIKLDSEKKEIHILSESSQLGKQEGFMSCDIEGETLEFALNSQYILDFLQVLNKNSFEIEAVSKLAAVVFRPESSDDYIHLIMPLKLD